jgi:hypothetical protein
VENNVEAFMRSKFELTEDVDRDTVLDLFNELVKSKLPACLDTALDNRFTLGLPFSHVFGSVAAGLMGSIADDTSLVLHGVLHQHEVGHREDILPNSVSEKNLLAYFCFRFVENFLLWPFLLVIVMLCAGFCLKRGPAFVFALGLVTTLSTLVLWTVGHVLWRAYLSSGSTVVLFAYIALKVLVALVFAFSIWRGTNRALPYSDVDAREQALAEDHARIQDFLLEKRRAGDQNFDGIEMIEYKP